MNTLCIIITIIELIENIKLFFLKVLVFCQISCIYIACENLYCIIVKLIPEVLLFAGPSENPIPPHIQQRVHFFFKKSLTMKFSL